MASTPFFPRLRLPGDALVRPQIAAGSPFADRMAGSWRLPCRVDATRGLVMSLLAAAPSPVGPLGMRFDAITHGATLPIALSAAPYTIAVWYKHNQLTSVNRRCIQGVTNNWLIGPYAGAYKVYNGDFTLGGPAITLFPVLHVVTDDGTTCATYVNGVAAGSRATGTHPGALAVGKGAFAESAESDISNITVWTRALSAAEVQQLPMNPDLLYRPRAYGFLIPQVEPSDGTLFWWNTYGQAGY